MGPEPRPIRVGRPDTCWARTDACGTAAEGSLRARRTRAVPQSATDATTGRLWLVLPYAPIAAAAVVAIYEEMLPGTLDSVVFWCVMAVIVGVVVRQFLMLTDNQL